MRRPKLEEADLTFNKDDQIDSAILEDSGQGTPSFKLKKITTPEDQPS
jgi:hypothetical protein